MKTTSTPHVSEKLAEECTNTKSMLAKHGTFQIMFKNKNEEEEEEEDPNASYNRKFYGDSNKYDEDYYNNYIKQYQAAQNLR